MTGGAGRTAVVVPVPDLEPLVGRIRARFDAAAPGVPAHVTVLYPFLPLPAVSADVLAELGRTVAAEPAPRVTFARCRRFPGVLWLDPVPAAPFARLTRALVAAWPEAQPYGGAYGDEPVPHLTVASTATEAENAEIEQSLAPSLPVVTVLDHAVLLGSDGRQWSVRHRFAFG